MAFDDEHDESGRKRKATSLIDDAAMEDDDVDDEDDEDDEDDDFEGPSRRGGSRRAVLYIDDDVAVDDDVEEEDDEEAELSDGELLHDVTEPVAKPSHYRRYEAAHDLPEDYDKLEAFIKERYQTVEYTSDAPTANQQSLVPTQLDPKLWVVQCRLGFERQLCLQLLNKYRTFRGKGTPLLIKSAVSLDHLKGYLYVEAEKESHVREAVQGMRYIQHSRGIKLVPLREMVSAITPNRGAKLPIEEGTWVRVRSGPYAHDLAKVIHVNLAQQKVDLKVVPRIDYAELVNKQEGRYISRHRDPFGKKSKVRHVARPFSREECRSLGLVVERTRGVNGEVYLTVGTYRFQEGYLIKTMSTRSIIVEDSVPPIEELHRFDAAAHSNTDTHANTEGLPEILESVSSKKHGLFKGDSVRVLSGDMMRMTGIVTDIALDGKILVKMDNRDVSGYIPFVATDLVKRFELGDHVCVREGMHRGQLGMVIKIDDRKCLILSDMDKLEFWATARDLSKTQESHHGYDHFGDYEVEDLVELQHHQFGVIVFADRDFCSILLAAGSPEKPEVKKTALQEIKCKCEARRNVTSDRYTNRIKAGDIVDFTMGASTQKSSGTVKYVSSPYLFIKMKDRTALLGYVAIHSKLCIVRGGYRPPMTSDVNIGLRSPAPRQLEGSFHEGGRFRGGRMSRGRSFLRGRGRGYRGQRESIMVKVIRGAHRGYRGRIKDETATHVRIELDAGSRVITVLKDNIECLESNTGGYSAANMHSDYGWNAQEKGTIYTPPKTPYGDNQPPTTPYSAGRESNTSPDYRPSRPPPTAEPEAIQEETESDEDLCFDDGDPPPPAVPPSKPKTPMPEPSPQIDIEETTTPASAPAAPPPLQETAAMTPLSSLARNQMTDLVVVLPDGSLGVTRDVSDSQACEIEDVSVREDIEERSLTPAGQKQRQSMNALKLTMPQKGDRVRVLEGMFADSIGQMIAVDGNDCIIRLDDGQIQIFSSGTLAVTLPPSNASV